jgi:aryl carrier-like protein
MVPVACVQLQRLPLTPSGKIDRKALPAPDEQAYAAREYEAPTGQIETALAQIWAEVLKLERVGRHDDFFALGGHSLLAVSVMERMRQAGLSADVRTLFATPTLAALAGAVGGDSGIVEVPPNAIPARCEAITPQMLPLVQLDQAQIDHIVATVPGGAANVQDIYPLAPLQEGILFHHLMVEQGDVYLMPALLSLDSKARVDAFVNALQAVIARHDILRTAVLWQGLAQPVQVVWRQAPLAVDEFEFDAAQGDIAEQLQARLDPRRHRIDVRQAPLMRVAIAQDTARDRWALLLRFHHLVMDHTAMEIVGSEVQAHFHGRTGQLRPPLPFRNFVAQAKLGVSQEEHETFFSRMLGDVQEPTLPFGLVDVQGDGSVIAQAHRELDAALAQRLRARARALGVSAASLCHLAWAQVLARVSGRDDVVFGTLLFGRMQGGQGADRALGLFINTLPVRVRIAEVNVRDGVREVHALLAELMRHEHASLALAQRCSAVAAPAPLFSALLNYRHSTVAGQSGTERQAWDGIEWLSGQERTNYPVTLSIDDLGQGFSLTAQVDCSIQARRVCDYMHQALEALVDALESAPSTPVHSLDVLPAQERHQLLVEWNATEIEYAREQCIHELFEEQVKRTPDATAVVHGDKSLSYAELNAQANRLAHHLRGLGVKPDSRVALCMQRSERMVVALLAVLKAGGAYVPMDPAYPRERLAYLLHDSAPTVVLVDGEGGQALGDGHHPPRLWLGKDDALWADAPIGNLPPGLRDLHLWVHRRAQGRGHRAPQPGQPGCLALQGLRIERGPAKRGDSRSGLRCKHLGDMASPVQRGHAGAGACSRGGRSGGAVEMVAGAGSGRELPGDAVGGTGFQRMPCECRPQAPADRRG